MARNFSGDNKNLSDSLPAMEHDPIIHRPSNGPSRRGFLKSSTALALGGSAFTFPAVVRGAPNGAKLKIGLIGCGGRGSGAAADALTADSNCELSAVADVFESNADNAINELSKKFTDRINVPSGRRFIGLDGFQKLMATDVDVVLLATPPGFRPEHLAAAVEAGKNVFCEKPMAVDPVGVRSVMGSVRKSKEKGLHLVAGFCWRYCHSRRDFFQAIHDGAIGDLASYYACYYTSPVKPMPPAAQRKPEWSDVEWQVRNWYNFSWLSGDGYVEQCIHSVDKVAWAFRDQPPLSCVATGGRQAPAEGGNIFDHMTAVYEYPNGVFATVGQRQIPGCFNDVADYIQGTRGSAVIGKAVAIRGEKPMRFREDNDAMYVQEHREFFKAIRSGEVINDGERMATSTLLGIMGRMAAYSGKKVTWEQALDSQEDLAPTETFSWNSNFEPMPQPIPGKYKVV
jgi:myo-inositol 2-dehydrogenase / D-chiro-inositol 1-dehydrogenase